VSRPSRAAPPTPRLTNWPPPRYSTSLVGVSVPETLVGRLDQSAEEHGHTGRSEVPREASRNLLGEFEDRRLKTAN